MLFLDQAETYLKSEVPILVQSIRPRLEPYWGTMNINEMVAHLIEYFKFSNGTTTIDVRSKPELIPSLQEFLNSSKPFPKNYKSPVNSGQLENDGEQLNELKASLLENIQLFYEYFQKHPDETLVNPVFGELSYNQWLLYHKKHISHHFSQFGIM